MRRLLALVALLALPPAQAAPPTTVPTLDLARLHGTWYELARKPVFYQRLCVRDVIVRFRPAEDGSLKVEQRCRAKSGVQDRAHGKARPVPGSGNAKLKVNLFTPLAAPYWVLWRDQDYRALLLGSPDRKRLWLLARAPKLAPELEQAAWAQARRQGYELGDLIRTPHGGVPQQK